MNHKLTEEQFDAYFEFMHHALIHARLACSEKDVKQADAIVDMLHNLPRFLRGSNEPWFESWTPKGYFELFVKGVKERYPSLPIPWELCPRE